MASFVDFVLVNSDVAGRLYFMMTVIPLDHIPASLPRR